MWISFLNLFESCLFQNQIEFILLNGLILYIIIYYYSDKQCCKLCKHSTDLNKSIDQLIDFSEVFNSEIINESYYQSYYQVRYKTEDQSVSISTED